MSVTYSQIDDMLIGDLTVSTKVDKHAFLVGAAREMNAKLGILYELPLEWDVLAPWAQALLQGVSNNLASGRLILSVGMAGEDQALHAYGVSLIQQAWSDFEAIIYGTLALEGAVPREDAQNVHGPSISNHDEYSAVDAFQDYAMRGDELAWWRPGQISP